MPEGDRKAGRKATPRRRTDPGRTEAAELRREGRRLARELKALQARCGALEERIENDQSKRRKVELRAGRLESELSHVARERDAAQTEALAARLRAERQPHEAAEASLGAAEAALVQAQAAVKQAVKACAAAAGRGERQVELRKVAEREVKLLRTALENAETRVLAAAEASHNGTSANGNGGTTAPEPAGQDGAAKRKSAPAQQPAAKPTPGMNGRAPVLPEHWRRAAHVAIRARLAQQEAQRFHVEQLDRPAEAGQL